ncbi:MAG: hypothetical protein ABIG32_03910 [Candidatus Uhrbacteria bacterium]|nr:hypothetical protein [Patescibacteria group bacterium]MBU1906533.1 hypothetical protein [Patescibacteria group bacterium]
MEAIAEYNSSLDQAIFRTVAYFSLFEYPLTAFEIWKWLLAPEDRVSFEQVQTCLDRSDFLSDRVVRHGAFWGLTGANVAGLVATRHERFLDAVRKYKRMKRVVRYLQLIPSIRGVAACNTLAWDNTRPSSDIDIFIVVCEGSVWTTRLLAVSPFKILKMRPGASKRDPLCFTFFLSDTNLDVSSLALEGGDPYLIYWSRSLVPVFDRDGVFAEFARANGWLDASLPNAKLSAWHRERAVNSAARSFRPPSWLETFARRIQKRRFPEVIQNMANRDTRVVVSDAMLKFHDNDRRAEYRDKLANLVGE